MWLSAEFFKMHRPNFLLFFAAFSRHGLSVAQLHSTLEGIARASLLRLSWGTVIWHTIRRGGRLSSLLFALSSS